MLPNLNSFTQVERLLLIGLGITVTWGSLGIIRQEKWRRFGGGACPGDLYRQLRAIIPDREVLPVRSPRSPVKECPPAPTSSEPFEPGLNRRCPTRFRGEGAEKIEVSEEGWVFSPVTSHEKININQAGMAELMTLPGIGPVMARRIIDYRRRRGGFASLKSLKKIKGIGEGRFAQLKNRVRVY